MLTLWPIVIGNISRINAHIEQKQHKEKYNDLVYKSATQEAQKSPSDQDTAPLKTLDLPNY